MIVVSRSRSAIGSASPPLLVGLVSSGSYEPARLKHSKGLGGITSHEKHKAGDRLVGGEHAQSLSGKRKSDWKGKD